MEEEGQTDCYLRRRDKQALSGGGGANKMLVVGEGLTGC